MARILIADDAAFMRMMLGDILTKAGHEVVGQAINGLEAVGMYQQMKPDLMITDITMPEMDGIQAVKEVRKLDPFAKIIICSAVGQKSLVNEAIQNGAKDFVLKPFQADQVIGAINKLDLMEGRNEKGNDLLDTEVLENPYERDIVVDNEDEEFFMLERAQQLLPALSKEELTTVVSVMELFKREKIS
jgi:two-component system chemotaxis response regulator CheY